MRDALEMLGLQALRSACAVTPYGSGLAIGRGVGRIVFRMGLRRRVCLQNLERAFGAELDARERRGIAARTYEHVGMILAEIALLPRMPMPERRRRLEIVGMEHLERAQRAGRGAVIASAHYGNWEFIGAGGVAHGIPVTFVVQRQRNRRADALLRRTREQLGMRILDRGMAVRRVRAELEANRFVGIMCDQDARRRGIFVPFFGRPASTHKGAAQLALRLGVPFIPLFGRRLPGGRHRMLVLPPIEPPRNASETDAVRNMMRDFNAVLESVIREEPDQYLWLHRRWKTQRPPAQPAGVAGY
jgi:Kdo2-lipid IVA lauroyltransferase/acyltransferase